MRRLISVLAFSLALSAPVSADPVQARQIQALQQALGALDARIERLETTLRQSQQSLDLLKEVETLKAEVARMRGQAEVQAHQMDTLGKRQNDLYVDLDQRLRELTKAPRPAAAAEAPAAAPVAAAAPAATAGAAAATAAAPAPPPQADPQAESRAYEAALNQFRKANYDGAIAGFRGFLKSYPDSALAPNAQYWIGYSYYALKDYKSALAHQQKLVAAYPGSAKVPDAMLNIATNLIGLDDFDTARKTLEVLVDKHPGTNAANLAARRLAALK